MTLKPTMLLTVELGDVASDSDVSEDEREDFAVEEDVFDDEI